MVQWGRHLDEFRERARRGDAVFRRRLATQPVLDEEAEPYFEAWTSLGRERGKTVLGAGMGGSIVVPDPVARDVIRRLGEGLGYDGGALERFVAILAIVDDHYVDLVHKKTSAEVETKLASANANRRP